MTNYFALAVAICRPSHIMPREKECPQCGGAGEFSVSSDPNARTFRCGDCEGTGTVARSVFDEEDEG